MLASDRASVIMPPYFSGWPGCPGELPRAVPGMVSGGGTPPLRIHR
jgi:hypothetical protein